LFFLHKSDGDRECETKLGVRKTPAGQALDPPQAVGDGIAMDPQHGRSLGDARAVEHGTERGEVLAAYVRPAGQERGQKGLGLALAIGQVVQAAQQPIGRQPIAPRHARRVREPLDRFQRGPGFGFGGGPVGVETIAAALGEPRDAIEDIVEPYLIQQSFVQRTPRGRVLTGVAFAHLGLPAPQTPPNQPALFADDQS